MNATISSRTPEGIPNRCPVCRGLAWIEPSQGGDGPCPRCGHLLWFDAIPARARSARRAVVISARGTILGSLRHLIRTASRLRPKPKPAPQTIAPATPADLYDRWLDG